MRFTKDLLSMKQRVFAVLNWHIIELLIQEDFDFKLERILTIIDQER